MKRRGLSFAELLIAIAILAMVLCGSMVFLQSNLMFYRRQISALRASLVCQDLLTHCPIPSGSAHGQVEDFEYAVDAESTTEPAGTWLHLTVMQGRNLILRQSRWRPLHERLVVYQSYETEEWKQIEVDGPGEMTISSPQEVVSEDRHALNWKGKEVFRTDSWIVCAQPKPDGTQIAFLQQAGDETQLWVIQLDTRRTQCWKRDLQAVDPPCWVDNQAVLLCQAGRQLIQVSASTQTVLYEGNGISAPSLSPDGKQICFISNPQDNNDIFVLDRRTRTVKNITQSDEGEIRPIWSPQGDQILFGVAPLAGGFSLNCIQANGNGRQDLHVVASGNHWNWLPSKTEH